MEVNDLQHVMRELPGGMVMVLNTGAVITPEAEAMLQALHSRSVGGIRQHLEVLAKRGADKFMSAYYVGYGHKSIGDCGTITIFIEGVSMLAAKAIQDWPLYSGQEASTRYIDFSHQPFVDPFGEEGALSAELAKTRQLYLDALDELVPVLIARYPRNSSEDEKKYEKAIRARAFDIARSLLPAGATTNLAWHSNLRQVADKLVLLRHHPLAEVQQVAEAIEDAVRQAHPASFTQKYYPATEKYNRDLMSQYYFIDEECPDFEVMEDAVNRELLTAYRTLMKTRPNRHTELPKHIAECGHLRFRFLLDFGSFRDIQRQRAVTQRMPLLSTSHGFEPWYLEQMPESLRLRVKKHLDELSGVLEAECVSAVDTQYFLPMGYRVPIRLTGNLHALTYLAERRARSDVHPTLQIRAHQIADELRQRFGPSGLILHTDTEPGRFDIKRGEQDIVLIPS
jgi:thymidylate synthase ThyX